jgi:hypothetical protein
VENKAQIGCIHIRVYKYSWRKNPVNGTQVSKCCGYTGLPRAAFSTKNTICFMIGRPQVQDEAAPHQQLDLSVESLMPDCCHEQREAVPWIYINGWWKKNVHFFADKTFSNNARAINEEATFSLWPIPKPPDRLLRG